MRRMWLGVVGILLLLTAGCGQSAQDQAGSAPDSIVTSQGATSVSPSPPETSSTEPLPATSPTDPPAPSEQPITLESSSQSPLRAQQRPPAGVSEQITVTLGAGGGSLCAATPPSSEPGIILRDPPTVGRLFYACVVGFVPGELRVELAQPDGRVRRHIIAPGTGFIDEATQTIQVDVTYWIAAGDPLGEYRLTVAQGATFVGVSFAVAPRSDPLFDVLTPIVAPGETVRLGMAGLPPNEPVTVHIYRGVVDASGFLTSQADYLGSLPPITPDANGVAVRSRTTAPDDALGAYFLWSPVLGNTPASGLNLFSLEPRSAYPGEPIGPGAEGETVGWIKQRLGALWYVGGPDTETFDNSIGEAVSNFQEDHQLPRTGVVDQATWETLFSADAYTT